MDASDLLEFKSEVATEKPVSNLKRGAARSAQGIKPNHEEVIEAIESLYADQMKPFGRILRKRISEHHVDRLTAQIADFSSRTQRAYDALPDVDIRHLRTICDESALLRIQPEEGGDWSAIFVDRPEDFVDIYDLTDSYSERTWKAAAEYFESLPEEEALLPGGRYSCAQVLLFREVPFLRGFTLGKVCHLVQLAISKHKILGYCNGAVVPYHRSQSRVKEECAGSQQPLLPSSAATSNPVATAIAAMPLASWDLARNYMREILENAALPDQVGPSTIPLSNVKRLFSSRYQTELSETSLGHSKLSELLQDTRFADICRVELQGQGYIVVQTMDEERNSLLIEGFDVAVKFDDVTPIAEQRRVEFCPDEPLSWDDGDLPVEESQRSPLQPMATPLASPGAPTPTTISRWSGYSSFQGYSQDGVFSLSPEHLFAGGYQSISEMVSGAQASWLYDSKPSSSFEASNVSNYYINSEDAAFYDSTGSTAESSGDSGSMGPRSPAQSTGASANEESAEPIKVETSLLKRMHSTTSDSELAQVPDGSLPQPRLAFCLDEPLSLEDAGIFETAPPGLDATPRLPSRYAGSVKNTFLHSAPSPLVTPLPGASRRSRSVPRTVALSGSAVEEKACVGTGETSLVVPTPGYLPPPTPSSPFFRSRYEGMEQFPGSYFCASNQIIRLADLI